MSAPASPSLLLSTQTRTLLQSKNRSTERNPPRAADFFEAPDETTAFRAVCVAEAGRIVAREGRSEGVIRGSVVGTARLDVDDEVELIRDFDQLMT